MKLLFGGYAYAKHRLRGLDLCPIVIAAYSEYEAVGQVIAYAKDRWLSADGYFEHNANLIQARQDLINNCASEKIDDE